MGAAAGIALRGIQFFVRGIQFCCAAIVLAIFSYFLATLSNHGMHVPTWVRAVEGISGAGVLYTVLALLALCCLAGRSLPSFVTMVLDVAFAGAFIYVAAANRGGASSCDGEVDTPFGRGNADTNVVDGGNGGFTALPSLRQACQMETACLSVSIAAVIFFVLSPFLSLALVRHRRKEKRFGPSPANDYTEGYGHKRRSAAGGGGGLFGRLFGRKRAADADADQDPNALPAHTTPDDMRNSYATEQTRVGSSGGGGGAGGYGGGGYGGLGDGTTKYGGPYGDNIPLANYPNTSSGYHRYDDNNGNVYR